jgi:hypothetical protein
MLSRRLLQLPSKFGRAGARARPVYGVFIGNRSRLRHASSRPSMAHSPGYLHESHFYRSILIRPIQSEVADAWATVARRASANTSTHEWTRLTLFAKCLLFPAPVKPGALSPRRILIALVWTNEIQVTRWWLRFGSKFGRPVYHRLADPRWPLIQSCARPVLSVSGLLAVGLKPSVRRHSPQTLQPRSQLCRISTASFFRAQAGFWFVGRLKSAVPGPRTGPLMPQILPCRHGRRRYDPTPYLPAW